METRAIPPDDARPTVDVERDHAAMESEHARVYPYMRSGSDDRWRQAWTAALAYARGQEASHD